jgi:hypothetical protein
MCKNRCFLKRTQSLKVGIGKCILSLFVIIAILIPAVVRGQTLSGKVVDCINNQPLAGVSVKIVSSTGGTS